mgnify:CR=1 FL=1
MGFPAKNVERPMYNEVKKKLSDLTLHEINYAIARKEGVLCVLHDWNGLFCKKIKQVPDITIDDENNVTWIAGYSFDILGAIQYEHELNQDVIDKCVKSIDKKEGKCFVSIEIDGVVSSASHEKSGVAYALALLMHHYGEDLDLEVPIGQPIRNYCLTSEFTYPGAKKAGIIESSFYK